MDRRVLAGVAVAVVAAGALALGAREVVKDDDGNGGSNAPAGTVSSKDRAFSPPTRVVARGETLRFTNSDDEPHTFTADGGAFHSGILAPGKSYDVTLSSVQTLRYHCEIHPGMQGTVEVR